MRKVLIAPAILLSVSLFAQQQDFSKVQMKVLKITDHVYMLTGAGGNIGVSVGDDGIVIIDDQFAPLAPKIKEALKAITNKPIKFIINTHYHGDHTGGNEIFGREGTIIAHDNARKRMELGTKVLGNAIPPAPKGALPVVTFNDRATIHVNGEDLRITHLPGGHTDGDVMVEFTKSNVVHMGDDYFNGMFPFVDRENGGSIRGLIANLDAVLAKMDPGAQVIPGHGPLGDKPSLDGFRDALKGTVAIMNEAIQKGKTLDEVKKEKTLVAWSHLASEFVTLEFYEEGLYNELKGGAAK
jgi:glyoxylase-like metal-dependent hydrolase (beta-lactamase superfamily II)